jgi:hypothetical protein
VRPGAATQSTLRRSTRRAKHARYQCQWLRLLLSDGRPGA